MNRTEDQAQIIRAALIAARTHYCFDQAEHGGDGMKTPEPSVKAAMEIMGMQWNCDVMKIYSGDEWAGNEQFKPSATNERARF